MTCDASTRSPAKARFWQAQAVSWKYVWPGYRGRQATLHKIAMNPGLGPKDNSRLAAYTATSGYPLGTVGFAVNRAIALLYAYFGTYGEAEIGKVFKSAEARRHYRKPVCSPSSHLVARMEYNYWNSVVDGDPWGTSSRIATAFDPEERDWLQVEFFAKQEGGAYPWEKNRRMRSYLPETVRYTPIFGKKLNPDALLR